MKSETIGETVNNKEKDTCDNDWEQGREWVITIEYAINDNSEPC